MILPPRGRSTSIGVKQAAVPSIRGHPAARDSSKTDGFVSRRSRSRPRRHRRRAGPPPLHHLRGCLSLQRDCTIYEGAAAVMLGWRHAHLRVDTSYGPRRPYIDKQPPPARCTNYEGADTPSTNYEGVDAQLGVGGTEREFPGTISWGMPKAFSSSVVVAQTTPYYCIIK